MSSEKTAKKRPTTNNEQELWGNACSWRKTHENTCGPIKIDVASGLIDWKSGVGLPINQTVYWEKEIQV